MYEREVGASERASARRDRITSMTDRGAGAHERAQAEDDRATSSTDREQGAGERAQAEDDRSTSHADRDAAARDREHSTLDPLTGAHTRGAGLVELGREIARAERTGQTLVLAFIDVDKLKVLNDTAGHAAGDDLLRAVAHTLTARLRSYDLIIRYGGDEFLCAVTGLNLDQTQTRLDEANTALSARTTPATFTAGLTTLNPGDTLDSLIARADTALYAARQRRRQPPS